MKPRVEFILDVLILLLAMLIATFLMVVDEMMTVLIPDVRRRCFNWPFMCLTFWNSWKIEYMVIGVSAFLLGCIALVLNRKTVK